MAMNGNTLGTAIGEAFYSAIPSDIKNKMTADEKTAMCNSLINNSKVIASCVVAHIIANAEVSVTVAAGIGVQAGSCTGSTTTTGSGTGTIA